MHRITCLVAAFVLTGCVSKVERDYLTPSEALAQRDLLDGRTVRLGGVVVLGTNSRCLWDSISAFDERTGNGDGVVTLSAGANLYERANELDRRFVVVEGTFRKTFNPSDALDLYQCNPSGIDQSVITPSRDRGR